MRKLFEGKIDNGRSIRREIWERDDGKWEARDYLISPDGKTVTFFKATKGQPEKLFKLDALGNPINFSKVF